MKTFETLASLDFGTILAEAIRDNKTQTGRELLEKYSAVLMNSPVTCNLVNQFVNEARNYLYDSAVAKAVNKVSQVISENKISWNLATASVIFLICFFSSLFIVPSSFTAAILHDSTNSVVVEIMFSICLSINGFIFFPSLWGNFIKGGAFRQ